MRSIWLAAAADAVASLKKDATIRNLIFAAVIAANASGAAMAQTANEHQGHHPGGNSVPAVPAPAQPPASSVPRAASPHTHKPMMGQMMPGMASDQMKQMDAMMGMMRKMMPMMESMQKSEMSPAARAEMMKQMMPMMQQMMGGTTTGEGTPARAEVPQHVRDYMQAMDRMHGPMNTGITALSPDEGFVRGMIPHHQGAIDMAKIVLQYGKDDQVRKWANDVIREQQREIAEMEAWLKKNGK